MRTEHLVLNTGRRLPIIGFGTWQVTPEQTARRLVKRALDLGYRLIDTARIYGNEAGVGQAIRESTVPREEVYLATKLWNDDQGYDRTLQAFEASLERLGLDYLDFYLIHWPATSRRYDSWRALEQLYEQGRIKAAGVCNYTVRHLQDLADRSQLIPAVNQIEFHPFIYEQQKAVLAYCQKAGILVEAYSPLSRVSSEAHEPILQLAERLHKTPQQIVLRWCVQHGTLPLARSLEPEHIASNRDITDFNLRAEDMDILDGLSDGRRVTWDPAGMG